MSDQHRHYRTSVHVGEFTIVTMCLSCGERLVSARQGTPSEQEIMKLQTIERRRVLLEARAAVIALQTVQGLFADTHIGDTIKTHLRSDGVRDLDDLLWELERLEFVIDDDNAEDGACAQGDCERRRLLVGRRCVDGVCAEG